MDTTLRGALGPRLIVGLAAIALGVLLTLDNLRLLDAGEVLAWWPTVLIALGAARLSRPEPGRVAGWVLVGVGAWILLYNLGIHPYDLRDGWPFVLILLGAGLIFTSFRRRARGDSKAGVSPTASDFALLAGHRLSNASQGFRGGDLSAVAGASILDLRGAATDGTAVVDTFAFWGGVEIRVPETWTVESRVIPVMGAFEDATRSPLVDTGNHLLVKGFALMGGVEVNNGPKGE